MNETYEIWIDRKGDELEVFKFVFPEDRPGKKMLSILLAQISQHLQDEVERMKNGEV
jgi:hypothetical protein